MNRIYVLVILVFIQLSVKAQDVWNFTITSVDSIEYTLYDYLDVGQPVIVDMFARYCASCSDAMPSVDSIWVDYGNGEDLQVWAMEVSGYHDTIVEEYKQDHMVSFPFFSSYSNPAFIDSFPISYTPWYIVFCPDYSYRHVEHDDLRHYVDACSTQNAKIISQSASIKVFVTNSLVRIYVEGFLYNKVEIINTLGQRVYLSKIEAIKNDIEIPISLNTGLYFIRLDDGKGKAIVKKFFASKN